MSSIGYPLAIGRPPLPVEDRRADRRGAERVELFAVERVEIDHRREAEIEVALRHLAVVGLDHALHPGLLEIDAGHVNDVDVAVDQAGDEKAAGAVDLGRTGRDFGWTRGPGPRDRPAAQVDMGAG